MKILQYPHPILIQKSESLTVEDINAELRTQVREMFDLMYKAGGVGLAAPQVGISKRFFVMNVGPRKEGKPDPSHERVWINPEIIEESDPELQEESCLSLPQIWGNVERSTKVTMSALDLEGNEQIIEASDFEAHVILHEIDHLKGILFIMHMREEDLSINQDALKAFKTEKTDKNNKPKSKPKPKHH